MDYDLPQLFSVAGKTALVTGGTSGIGLMIAQGLVAAGARTIIVARNDEDCARLARELGVSGRCEGIPGDLATLAGIDAITASAARLTDRLDILVNCAGLFAMQPLDEYTEQLWDYTLDLNLKAPFFLTQRLLPLLRAAASPEDPARVVNIGSGHGLRASPLESYAYASSKAALHHLTRSLAQRLARESITVNAIAPGIFPSRNTAEFSPERKSAIAKGVPLQRLGTSPDIIGALLYLASRAGAYVTASVLPVDGGWSGAG